MSNFVSSDSYEALKVLAESLLEDIGKHEVNLDRIKGAKDYSMAVSRMSNTKTALNKVYDSMMEWERAMEDSGNYISMLDEAWINVIRDKFKLSELDMNTIHDEVLNSVRNSEKGHK